MIQDTLIEQNTAHVEQATGEMSYGQIEDIRRRASANVQAVESEEGRISGGENAVSILLDAGLDAALPGYKMLKDGAQLGLQRMEDVMETKSRGAVSMDQHIRDSVSGRGAGENLISRINIAASALTNKAAGDKATDDLFGGGKKNASNIPTDEKAASAVSHSQSKVIAVKHLHKLALDSVGPAHLQRGAAMYHAQQMAPHMGLGSGPRAPSRHLLSETDQYQGEGQL